jgi:hypothetical protein
VMTVQVIRIKKPITAYRIVVIIPLSGSFREIYERTKRKERGIIPRSFLDSRSI